MSKRRMLMVSLAALAFLNEGGTSESQVPQRLGRRLKIYMHPNGNDTNPGTVDAPVKSLWRVQDILRNDLEWPKKHNANVEVHIWPYSGPYYQDSIVWTVTDPVLSITFMPQDGVSTRPVFSGCPPGFSSCTCGQNGTCPMTPACQYGFFEVRAAGPTNLHFRSIRVERYSNGITFRGPNEQDDTLSNSHNSVDDGYFYRIGSAYNDRCVCLVGEDGVCDPWDEIIAQGGVGALNISNSDHNVVTNTSFVSIVNKSPQEARLHAIYMSHHSDENVVTGNVFSVSKGVALKLRNACWWNLFEYNRFTRDGGYNHVTAAYADMPIIDDPSSPPELSSCQSVFRYNIIDGTYNCTKLSVFYLRGPDTCGPGYQRLSTAGNTDDLIHCNGQ
jgi:hypothetical protein